jgi:c-di-GMP-binding flagellar brake protein YcgR
MDKWEGQERRRYPRLKGATVEYIPIGKASPKEMSFTEDISAVGIRILASENIDIDIVLLLKIYLPHYSEPVKAKGRVVWTRQSRFLRRDDRKAEHYDIGIEFMEISDDDQSKICQYTVDQTIDDNLP